MHYTIKVLEEDIKKHLYMQHYVCGTNTEMYPLKPK